MADTRYVVRVIQGGLIQAHTNSSGGKRPGIEVSILDTAYCWRQVWVKATGTSGYGPEKLLRVAKTIAARMNSEERKWLASG